MTTRFTDNDGDEVDLKKLPAGSVVKFRTKHGSEYEVLTSGTTTSNLTPKIGGLTIKTDSDLAVLDPERQNRYEAISIIKVGTFWVIDQGAHRTSRIVSIEVTTPDQ